jgi:hypothetical protein
MGPPAEVSGIRVVIRLQYTHLPGTDLARYPVNVFISCRRVLSFILFIYGALNDSQFSGSFDVPAVV